MYKYRRKKVIVKSDLPTDLDYLQPLFHYIKQASPVKISKVVGAYNFSITDKHLKQLVNSVGDSLAKANTVVIKNDKSGSKYVPNKSSINKIIDKIRAEIFEDELITQDVTILVILLNKSGLLKDYFSKHEQIEIKEKLNELNKTESANLVQGMINKVEGISALLQAPIFPRK
ncbi:GPP34 family phosphoprotein [Oceanobacillus jeddahense]|uniref:GPP34 family phosphoprotein n=1 Tax=Oceanobacillus jeddahense TaxID=1462527 RepID=A0ABY5JNJ8_9BACI|nr:GPP34 family phosphoprotein [Oceanobacillus jeddahense]UUI01399.1 GPP34 family phosphoprotein [Oceanobacillus jeddahense]